MKTETYEPKSTYRITGTHTNSEETEQFRFGYKVPNTLVLMAECGYSNIRVEKVAD